MGEASQCRGDSFLFLWTLLKYPSVALQTTGTQQENFPLGALPAFPGDQSPPKQAFLWWQAGPRVTDLYPCHWEGIPWIWGVE